jgi:hypothetical protein
MISSQEANEGRSCGPLLRGAGSDSHWQNQDGTLTIQSIDPTTVSPAHQPCDISIYLLPINGSCFILLPGLDGVPAPGKCGRPLSLKARGLNNRPEGNLHDPIDLAEGGYHDTQRDLQ